MRRAWRALRPALPLLAGAAVLHLAPASAAAGPGPPGPAGPAAVTHREADTTAVLTGRVLLTDVAAPAEGARVEITGQGRTALTDSLGRFRLAGLEPGPDTLRVSTLEGRSATRAVALEAGAETEVEITLEPRVVDVGGLEVTVEGPRRTELRRLADRIDRGVGSYITREELEDAEGRLSRSFRRMLGVDVRYVSGGDFRVLMRRRIGRGYCSPQLFVDGSPMPGVAVDAFHPDDVAAVEVYTSDVVPGEYRTTTTMECGAVLLWTLAFVQ